MEDGPESVFSQLSRPKKYLATFGIIYCCFSLGISGPFLNPAVVDFSHKLNEPVDRVSVVFSVFTATFLCGALLNAIISGYIPRPISFLLSLCSMTLPLFTIPYVESLMMLYVLVGAIGFGCGGIDAAVSAWIIDIWRHEAAPFILTINFAYSVGTLIPPLILGPYLQGKTEETDGTTKLPYESNLQVPFTIGGAIACFAIVIQAALYFFVYRQNTSSIVNQNKNNEIEMKEANPDGNKEIVTEIPSPSADIKRLLFVVGLSCCVVAFYVPVELCTQQFIPTFSHFSEVGLSEQEGADISFGLQMGYASGRFLGILLVLKIAPHFILTGNYVLLLISNVILLVWAGSDVTWLRVGSIGFGLGMSTVYPSIFAFIEKYVFVTDRISASIAACGGLVSAIYPVIVGNSVEKNPQVLPYVNFFSLFICLIAFSILFYITHVKASRMQKATKASESN